MEKTKNFIQATGRRKTSVAQVKLFENGSGLFKINSKTLDEYFGGNFRLKSTATSPLQLVENNTFDCSVKVVGGGTASQAGAIKHGIARALSYLGDSFKARMKKAGYLTRDSRMVERKKSGRPKARKRFQFSKR